MSKVPEELTEYPSEVMSNFDHDIDEDVIKVLKKKKYWSRYSGWDFNGRVWYADGKWHCEPWHYHVPQEVITATTPQELMDAVCAEWGDE